MKIKTTRYVMVAVVLMMIAATVYIAGSRLRTNLGNTAWMVLHITALIFMLTGIALLLVAFLSAAHLVQKRMLAFGHAWRGIIVCLENEIHFRIHCCAAILVVVLGFLFPLSKTEWAVLVVCIALVLTAELLNSALEHLCNVVQPMPHPAIKTIKDMAAGAVLIAACGSMVTGLIIFLPKIISFVNTL